MHGEISYRVFGLSSGGELGNGSETGGEFEVVLQNQSPHYIIAEIQVKLSMNYSTTYTHTGLIGLSGTETKKVSFREKNLTTASSTGITNVEFEVVSIKKVYAKF